MDVEKAASKGHGFFSLFDWGKSKKSKKRLFSASENGSPTLGNTGDGKEVDGCTPSTQSNSILEDAPSLKESSEHSCSSSVIDDVARARRGPTVVARLMGLDFMPAASSSESYSMHLTEQQPFQNNVHDELIGRSYVTSPSPHKMPGSPIDRFRMEALPPKFAKRTLSGAQYKSSSPVKIPNHTPSRSGAEIMEAASRIIGPGVENTGYYKDRDVGYTNAVRAFNPAEVIRAQQSSPRLNEALKKRDGSASYRLLSIKPLDGSLKSSESTSSSRISQLNGGAPVVPKVNAGSRSSPDSRARNIQGREGISKNSRKVATRRDPGHNMVERNECKQQKSNNQMGIASSSNVPMQNNRKQNGMGVKHKVNSKSEKLSQQRSNMRSMNASPRKAGVTSTHSENSTQSNKKLDLQPANCPNRRLNLTAKTTPKPRRLPDGRMHSKKSQSSDIIVTDRSQKRVQHNIVIDQQSSFSASKKRISTKIVSFTFTTPVDRSLPGSHISNHLADKRSIENVNSPSTSSNKSNTKPDAIDGDYLGLLLEQKLKELTSGVRSPYSRPSKGVRIYAPSPVLEDTASVCETSSIASTDYEMESLQSFKDGKTKFVQVDLASKGRQSSQYAKYDHDVMDQTELEHLHQSPNSTWEASISTETCSSGGSWRSANETRLSSSTEGAGLSASARYGRFLEGDALSEYSDTASSITVTTAEIPRSESSSSGRMDCQQEIDFVREIFHASSPTGHVSSCWERFACSDNLDPHLLEELNGNFRLAVGDDEGKSLKIIRRLLFDCVNEVMSVKSAYYFNAGYTSWFMGIAILQKLSPEEMYQEMTSLKVADEWMVDELVYKEMGSPLGSWIDFKTESYEAGKDIATDLLGSLIDEMVADLLTDVLL